MYRVENIGFSWNLIDFGPLEIVALQVSEAVEEWREMLTAHEQAGIEAEIVNESNQRQMQNQARASEAGPSRGPGAIPSSASRRNQAGNDSDSSDDDALVITEALGLDEAIAVSKFTNESQMNYKWMTNESHIRTWSLHHVRDLRNQENGVFNDFWREIKNPSPISLICLLQICWRLYTHSTILQVSRVRDLAVTTHIKALGKILNSLSYVI